MGWSYDVSTLILLTSMAPPALAMSRSVACNLRAFRRIRPLNCAPSRNSAASASSEPPPPPPPVARLVAALRLAVAARMSLDDGAKSRHTLAEAARYWAITVAAAAPAMPVETVNGTMDESA